MVFSHGRYRWLWMAVVKVGGEFVICGNRDEGRCLSGLCGGLPCWVVSGLSFYCLMKYLLSE
jgi:IS1 family transposase